MPFRRQMLQLRNPRRGKCLRMSRNSCTGSPHPPTRESLYARRTSTPLDRHGMPLLRRLQSRRVGPFIETRCNVGLTGFLEHVICRDRFQTGFKSGARLCVTGPKAQPACRASREEGRRKRIDRQLSVQKGRRRSSGTSRAFSPVAPRARARIETESRKLLVDRPLSLPGGSAKRPREASV
jgi:hypothetical protein